MADSSVLVNFLAARDVPCPVCRYNLRGLTSDRCPECSAPLRLDVASPSLRLGPYLFTIVSFALGAGFDLVVTFMLSVATVGQMIHATPAMWIRSLVVVGLLGSAGMLCLGLIWLLVHERHRWNRIGVLWQRLTAAGVFLMVGVGHLGLGFIIMLIL